MDYKNIFQLLKKLGQNLTKNTKMRTKLNQRDIYETKLK